MTVINNVLHQDFAAYPKFGVLQGVKVFVTGTNIAGPFAGCLMAEMGAQVLQAELPKAPCQTRGNYSWAQNHRNCYSITLNTATARGKNLFLKAIEWADIWIEAGRPGGYDKRGLTDEVCWEHNKKLAIVHVSGYGQFGPSKDKASYDVSGQAMGGYMYTNGASPTASPLKVNPYLSDYVTAYNACIVGLAGYIHALNFGEGDSCDVAQYDNMLRLMDEYPARWFNKGYPAPGEPVKERSGNKHEAASCFSFYDTADGSAIFVGMVGVGPVERGYPLIGLPAPGSSETFPGTDLPCDIGSVGYPLQDPRGPIVEETITKFCAERNVDDLVKLFNDNDIPNQKAYGPKDMLEDPQYEARENIVIWEDAVYGEMKGIGITNRFKKNPSKIVASAPTVGEHNREIFKLWGVSDAEVEEMYAKGEATEWDAKRIAEIKRLKDWGFLWDPERQCKRLGLE